MGLGWYEGTDHQFIYNCRSVDGRANFLLKDEEIAEAEKIDSACRARSENMVVGPVCGRCQ